MFLEERNQLAAMEWKKKRRLCKDQDVIVVDDDDIIVIDSDEEDCKDDDDVAVINNGGGGGGGGLDIIVIDSDEEDCKDDDDVAVNNGGGGFGWWEDLNSEILALIFVRIPADECARVVPFVCRSWRDVVAGSYCWSDIDIERWCRRCNNTYRIDFVVRKLMRQSKGTCRRLSVYKLGNAAFSFAASSARLLKVLQIPMSEVTDSLLQNHMESLTRLTFVDLSYCLNITCKGIEMVGKNCKSLIRFRRNMPPAGWDHESKSLASKTDDGEAMAIADNMRRLQHLELAYGRFTDLGLDAILTKCKNLKNLDIQGCPNVEMKGDLWDKCDGLVVFKGPFDDYNDLDYSDSDSNDDGNGDGEVSDG